jgi:hypothetical protein
VACATGTDVVGIAADYFTEDGRWQRQNGRAMVSACAAISMPTARFQAASSW